MRVRGKEQKREYWRLRVTNDLRTRRRSRPGSRLCSRLLPEVAIVPCPLRSSSRRALGCAPQVSRPDRFFCIYLSNICLDPVRGYTRAGLGSCRALQLSVFLLHDQVVDGFNTQTTVKHLSQDLGFFSMMRCTWTTPLPFVATSIRDTTAVESEYE